MLPVRHSHPLKDMTGQLCVGRNQKLQLSISLSFSHVIICNYLWKRNFNIQVQHWKFCWSDCVRKHNLVIVSESYLSSLTPTSKLCVLPSSLAKRQREHKFLTSYHPNCAQPHTNARIAEKNTGTQFSYWINQNCLVTIVRNVLFALTTD